MPYAIKENGQFRSVTPDMDLEPSEALSDTLPDWLLTLLEKQRADALDLIREAGWRSDELSVTARQLEAIEEDEADVTPPDLLPGTRKQWLKYRGQVSNWKEATEFFPDLTHRPIRPA